MKALAQLRHKACLCSSSNPGRQSFTQHAFTQQHLSQPTLECDTPARSSCWCSAASWAWAWAARRSRSRCTWSLRPANTAARCWWRCRRSGPLAAWWRYARV